MTERMERRRLDLIARQQAGEMMPCPRCGADSMKRPIHTNAMSRTDGELYVCDACGATEAVLAYMKQESPLSQWAAFQPRQPEKRASIRLCWVRKGKPPAYNRAIRELTGK